MNTIKAVYRRMLGMCPAAWRIFLVSLQLSCALLFASLLLHTGVFAAGDHAAKQLAAALYELPQSVLLIGLLVSVCLEDICSRRS